MARRRHHEPEGRGCRAEPPRRGARGPLFRLPDHQQLEKERMSNGRKTGKAASTRHVVEDHDDYLLISDSEHPAIFWRLTMTDIIGASIEGAGYLVEIEALEGLNRIGRIAFQWDATLRVFRVYFAAGQGDVTVQVTEMLPAGMHLAISARRGVYSVLFDPRTREFVGSVPEADLDVVRGVARLFAGVEEPLLQWVAHEEQINDLRAAANRAGSPVILRPGGDKCKRDRKIGWVKVAAIAGGAILAAALSGGVGPALLAGVLGGIGAGAEIADTENKYKDCKEQAEEEQDQV
jgi:hypothetical protein